MMSVVAAQFKAIEDEIDLGQIEEVIEMAKSELELIDYYYGKIAGLQFCISRLKRCFNLSEEKGWELVAEARAKAAGILVDMDESIRATTSDETTTYK